MSVTCVVSDVMFDQIAIDPSEPVTLVAAGVALVSTILLTHPAADRLGRDTRLWRRVRSLLPHVDDAARDRGFYAARDVTKEQLVGILHIELPRVEHALRGAGFRLSPLAAHKAFLGHGEVGSWARFGPLRPRSLPWPLSTLYLLAYPYQTHVTLFPDGEGGVLVTAHHEYSAYNPLVAYWHLRGKGIDVDRGVREVTDVFADHREFEPSERAADLALKEAAENVSA